MKSEDRSGAGPFAAARSLPAAFRTVARTYGDNVAVVDGTRSLTYAELDLAADRLAATLPAHGVGAGEFVGLVVDRTVDTPIAILGLLKAGCPYVPLDPGYPPQRIHHVVEDTGIRFLVGRVELADELGLGHLETIDQDTATEGTREQPRIDVDEDDPAYVIYTSGSTGLPKGCVISHRNVLSLMRNGLPLFDLDATDRWTLFHSFGFDFSVWELWGALLTGGTAVCVSDHEAGAPEDLLDLLIRERVTVLNQVPSVFRALARIHDSEVAERLSLRYVIFGGENVDLDVVGAYVAQAGPWAPVMVNMYGITETTVLSTIKVLTGRDYDSGTRSPIGVPLPHVTVSLRDEHRQPVIDGEPGEMYIGGDSVGVGYHNRAELTAQRFVTLETPTGPARFYRSGDIARWTASGELDYLGRNDHQVKVRGFRIELGEIESVLRGHAMVGDAAVTTVARAGSEPLLVACVVPMRTEVPRRLSDELRRHAGDLLPRHMVPGRFEIVDSLPLTASGKLDRGALQSLVRSDSDGKFDRADFVAPRSPVEKAIAEIWTEVLGVPRVGIFDNFFELGGHSLLATQIISRIRCELAIEVRPRMIFEFPTVVGLAEQVGAAEPAPPPIPRRAR